MEGSEEQKIPSDHENVNFRNQDPAFFTDFVGGVGGFFAAYGWILLAVAIVMWYASQKLSRIFNRQLASLQSRTQYSSIDPDRAFQQAEAMERVRRRMQEELDAKAARYIEEQKIKDEEKRKQQIEEWEKHREGKGYKSKYKPQESQPSSSTASASKPSTVPSTSSGPRRNVYRSTDYNPLSGSSGGSSYRPSPRCGPSGGGG